MPPSPAHQGSPGRTVQPGPWSLSRAKHGARLVIMWAVGTQFDDPPVPPTWSLQLPSLAHQSGGPIHGEKGVFILQSFEVDAALGKETHRRPTVTPRCLDKY